MSARDSLVVAVDVDVDVGGVHVALDVDIDVFCRWALCLLLCSWFAL